jgi:antitoxin MazE
VRKVDAVRTQVGKWGNSLAIRIPGAFAKDLQLEEGTELEISLVDGAMFVRPASRNYTLEELVSQISLANRHEETDWGEAVGRESR